MPNRKPQSAPATLRPFSITHDEPTGELDGKGRPITRPQYIVVETPEDALVELERQLRDRDGLSSPLKDWLGDAIRLHRTNRRTFPTLDRALGLSKGKGSPGQPDAHEKLARSILALRFQDKSWSEIATTLAATTGIHRDVRTLQRTYSKYKIKLLAEELARRLDLNDSDAER